LWLRLRSTGRRRRHGTGSRPSRCRASRRRRFSRGCRMRSRNWFFGFSSGRYLRRWRGGSLRRGRRGLGGTNRGRSRRLDLRRGRSLRTHRRTGWSQIAHLAHNHGSTRRLDRLRRSSNSRPAALADDLLQSVSLIRIEVAQLVLDVDAMLTAQVEEVLTLHVQLARQHVDSNFVFCILQAAKLLCRQPPRSRCRAG
jgi:hypothetical protein